MAASPRATGFLARRRGSDVVLIGVAASVLLVMLVTMALGAVPVRGADLAVCLALAIGAHVAVRRRARRSGTEATLWRWLSVAATLLTLGMVAELVLDVVVLVSTGEGRVSAGHGPPPGLAMGVSAVLACPAMYQGLAHWNRQRTRVFDPGDWLNGVAAVLALVAIGLAAIGAADGALDHWPTWQLAVWLVQGAILLVLSGTAFTVISLGGLERDPRSWTVASTFAVAAAAQMAAAGVADDAAGRAELIVGRATVASWTAAMVGVLIAAALPARVRAPRRATSQATTVGAIAVLASAVGVATFDALVADPELRWSTALAALAALIAVVRLGLVVRELAQLALSRWEARTDELTGVPNRRHLMETLKGLGAAPASVVLVDLERFKEVNDRFGHGGGDEVIRVVAARMADRVVGEGTLARLGGDEFAVVLPGASLMAGARVADDLLARIAEPLEVRGEVVRMGASLGVAQALAGDCHEELMRCADTALNHAKRAGGGVRLYDEAADAQERAERRLTADLLVLLGGRDGARDADRPGGVGRLVVHYQPMVDARTRRPVGVEALVRWQHPERGLLVPGAFIDLVERHGLMGAVTAHVLEEAIAEVCSWEGEAADARLSVNLSSSCIENDRLVEAVADVLGRHAFPPGRLVLEVTETTAVRDDAGAVEVARRLAGLGVGLSIDDYGTGYSSLARVLALPAEELKLDRSFTLRVTADDRTADLVAGTIEFAHRMGLRVVAEGVEDEATFDAVASLGCDVTQGYLHSRPMPAEEVRAWFAQRSVVLPAPRGRRS